ncbi:unnamed protein product [Wickerhamomyces anomalus]
MDQINEIDNKVQCVVHEFRNDQDWVNIKRSMVRVPQILKQKINIGHQLPKDETFESLYSKFQEMGESVIALETEVNRYAGYVRSFIKHSILIGESMAEVFNPNLEKLGKQGDESPASKALRLNIEEDYSKFVVTKRYVEQAVKIKSQRCSDLDLITNNVQIPLARLAGEFKKIKRYVKERDFALLDVNKYYNDFHSLDSKEKSSLTLKQEQNLVRYEKNFEISKLKFEKINDSLKNELPQFFSLVHQFIHPLLVLFYYLQLTVHFQFQQNFGELSSVKSKPEKLKNKDLKTFIDGLVEQFHSEYDSTKQITDTLDITCGNLLSRVNTSPEQEQSFEEQNDLISQVTETESVPTINNFCIAKYNYKAEQDGDLSFKKGDRIKLLDQKLKEWWKGELDGHVGLFPYNYVQFERN